MRSFDHDPERVVVRGGTLAFWHRGHGGVPLLLVHGWPSTRRIWARNIVDLAARGFEVIAPDLRGFGDSDCGADGLHDVVAHSLDMAALLVDRLELEKVVAVGGDLGAAVVQDLSLRFPGLVDRLVVFNGPLPSLAGRTAHLPRDERRFEDSHGFRPATEPDALLAELATPQATLEYVARHYPSWSPPGAFDDDDLAYLAEPFADAVKLRASFGTYDGLIDPGQRTGRSMIAAGDTPADPGGPGRSMLPSGLRAARRHRVCPAHRPVPHSRRGTLPAVGGPKDHERRHRHVLRRPVRS